MAGPVVPWASLCRRFHLRANFAGRECRQEARASFGSKQAAPGESGPLESTVKSKVGHHPPLPACEPEPGPLAVLTWPAARPPQASGTGPTATRGGASSRGPCQLGATVCQPLVGLAQGFEMILFSAPDSLFSPHSS